MKQIDRLIIKAKERLEPKKEKLIYVFVGDQEPDIVSFMLWNGIPGEARTLEYRYSTTEEVMAKIEEIYREYPPNDKVVHGINFVTNSALLISLEE